jgi:hypothetical protein
MAKELQGVSARLEAIESHPAMAMTPERYAGQLAAAASARHSANFGAASCRGPHGSARGRSRAATSFASERVQGEGNQI